eukprot:CAMPEP_0197050048 /NCGR_PEP_ID=MMETSP1384-20130603/25038_1 /TAXON_ID=29189 /ORGANISM="Ammonia sp." /LENGTH=758 /DNA_ID=CAMNT_0042482409 /DNA_START=86 /DNA_END=2362 /DNA_ORIENTATION=-
MSAKFVPPKLDMGPGFATASSIKAKHKAQTSGDVGTPTTVARRKKASVPLTIENLALYFDWRRGAFEQSPTLFKLASIIWLYLPEIPMETYYVNFESTSENKVIQSAGAVGNMMGRPPAIVTTSPKGDLLIMVENQKKLDDYEEDQFLLILFPYIDDCRFIDESVQLSGGEHCTFWEIDGVEHLTHIAMDKLGIIYFTTGESVYRILKADGDMYLDTFEEIFTPSNDTSHITCLWRQNNDIFLTIQDWDTEENLDVYKLRPAQDKGVSTPDSPATTPKRKRTRSRSNSGYGSDISSGSPRGHGTSNDSNEFVSKVRSFSLEYNQRIWQLGTMRYEKKFVLAMGCGQMGSKPLLLQIGFKKKINPLTIMNKKSVVWPQSAPDEVPHSIYIHKQTKTWFCILPVRDNTDAEGRSFWMQWRLNKTKKKVTWQRLVPIPPEAVQGTWLYYDDSRDVLVGYTHTDMEKNEYVFKFMPDMTKHLWVDLPADDSKEDGDGGDVPSMQMQRSFRSNNKKTGSAARKRSSGKLPSLRDTNSATLPEPNIKPSMAANTKSKDGKDKSGSSKSAKKSKSNGKGGGGKHSKAKSKDNTTEDDVAKIKAKIKKTASSAAAAANKKKDKTGSQDSKKKKKGTGKGGKGKKKDKKTTSKKEQYPKTAPVSTSRDMEAIASAFAAAVTPAAELKAEEVETHVVESTEKEEEVADESQKTVKEKADVDKFKRSGKKKTKSKSPASTPTSQKRKSSPRKSYKSNEMMEEQDEDVMD